MADNTHYPPQGPTTVRDRGTYEQVMSQAVLHGEMESFSISHVSWGSIYCGAVLALVINFVLNLLGVGVGALAVNTSTTGISTTSLSVGTFFWCTIVGIIASFVGGYCAARLAGIMRQSIGGLYGLITWGVSVLVVLFLVVGGAGALVSGTYSPLPYSSAGSVGTATPAAPNVGGPAGVANPSTSITAPTSAGTVTIDAATVSKGALVSTLALVLAAIAAWFGGWVGVEWPTKDIAGSSTTVHSRHTH